MADLVVAVLCLLELGDKLLTKLASSVAKNISWPCGLQVFPAVLLYRSCRMPTSPYRGVKFNARVMTCCHRAKEGTGTYLSLARML